MFALAIWDRGRRRLLLARDRVGIKPLVYAWDERGLRFASEIKAILEDRDVPRDLDWDALGAYLTHHYIPAPRTIFRSIRKLPPASYLLWSGDGGAPSACPDVHPAPLAACTSPTTPTTIRGRSGIARTS